MKIGHVSWIPAIVLMCIIFAFSDKTAVESDGSSLQIANVIVEIYENNSSEIINSVQKQEILFQINHIVRKLSHGLEYGVLAVCVIFHLWVSGMKRWKLYLITILTCGIYACTDEVHQLFVVGRSSQITDVMIDITGATIGATCFMILIFIRKKIKRKNII